MKYQFKIAALTAIGFIMAIVSSCSKSDSNANPLLPGDSTGTPITASILLRQDIKLGTILTDSLGRSLYFFAKDGTGNSGCLEGCTISWPVFYRANLTISISLDKADFGTITRTDGTQQNTYKGWPLYYYNGDTKAGYVNGDGSVNTWFVAKPDYTVMLVNQQLTGEDGVAYNSSLQPGQEETQYLTDDHGRTLYISGGDAANTNNYTSPDLSNNNIWPMFQTADSVYGVPSTLKKSAFGTITVGGKTQITYKGWPLYYYSNDKQIRGNNKGVSITTPSQWSYINGNSAVAVAK